MGCPGQSHHLVERTRNSVWTTTRQLWAQPRPMARHYLSRRSIVSSGRSRTVAAALLRRAAATRAKTRFRISDHVSQHQHPLDCRYWQYFCRSAWSSDPHDRHPYGYHRKETTRSSIFAGATPRKSGHPSEWHRSRLKQCPHADFGSRSTVTAEVKQY